MGLASFNSIYVYRLSLLAKDGRHSPSAACLLLPIPLHNMFHHTEPQPHIWRSQHTVPVERVPLSRKAILALGTIRHQILSSTSRGVRHFLI